MFYANSLYVEKVNFFFWFLIVKYVNYFNYYSPVFCVDLGNLILPNSRYVERLLWFFLYWFWPYQSQSVSILNLGDTEFYRLVTGYDFLSIFRKDFFICVKSWKETPGCSCFWCDVSIDDTESTSSVFLLFFCTAGWAEGSFFFSFLWYHWVWWYQSGGILSHFRRWHTYTHAHIYTYTRQTYKNPHVYMYSHPHTHMVCHTHTLTYTNTHILLSFILGSMSALSLGAFTSLPPPGPLLHPSLPFPSSHVSY